jgi:hypothetical protein
MTTRAQRFRDIIKQQICATWEVTNLELRHWEHIPLWRFELFALAATS